VPWRIGTFELDEERFELRSNGVSVALGKQALELMLYLARRTDSAVSREQLLRDVWGVKVSEDSLNQCVRRIRRALGDARDRLRTVRGYGYQLRVERMDVRSGALGSGAPPAAWEPPESPAASAVPALIGRDKELTRLRALWNCARQSESRLVLVTGERGIGKTAVVTAFLAALEQPSERMIATGQCVEHHGDGEAYLPLLLALGELCRGCRSAEVIEVLRVHAPLWLLQLPELAASLNASEWARLRFSGAAPGRMLREFGEVVRVLGDRRPLALVLEDLHWADHATLDVVSYLVRHFERLNLLLIGTCSSGTLAPKQPGASEHPVATLRRRLALHPRYEELAVPPLGLLDVLEYLEARFSGQWSLDIARIVRDRTGGNPLLLARAVEALGEACPNDDLVTHSSDLETLPRRAGDADQEMIMD
jgi:DNA-binding winged helix-turn-helix (wHTH) protein